MKTLPKLSLLVLLAVLFFNGCKKDLVVKNATPLPDQIAHAGSIPDDMILTPRGLMPRSQVHLIEPGYQLEIRGSHVLKVKTSTGEMQADFGAVRFDAPGQPPVINQPANQTTNPAAKSSNLTVTQTNGAGWKTYSEWNAGTNVPIGTFSTKWNVPSNPATTTPQIVYIGDGISSAQYTSSGNPLVIQPILEWGNNGISGTGASWTISSWCCWNGGAAYTTPVATTTSTNLQGVITLTAQQTGGSYNYTSAFNGISGTSLTVVAGTLNGAGNSVTFPNIPVMSWAYETLQGYSVTSVGQYPSTFPIQMTNATIQTGLPGSFITPSPFSWTAVTATGASQGESTTIVTNAATNGEVDFYCHYQAPSITYPSHSVTINTCGAMTPLTPTNTGGGGVTYSISPALPANLTFNTSTGVISGTPLSAASATNYTVTATNNGGTSNFVITLTITGPTTISYPSTEIYNDGTAITPVTPTVGGTVPNNWTVSPALPAGLTINSSTGVISGTPTAPTGPTTYTITGTNGSCSGQGTINIATCFAFTVDNASSMNLSITFKMNSNGYQYGGNVVPAGNTNFTFWLPPGNYYVVTNNAGSGMYQLYMDFETQGPEEIDVTNGYTFTSVNISTSNSIFYLRNH